MTLKRLAESVYDALRREAHDGECRCFTSIAVNPLRRRTVYRIPFLYTQAGYDRFINRRSWELLAAMTRDAAPDMQEAGTPSGRARIRRMLLTLYFDDFIEIWKLLGRAYDDAPLGESPDDAPLPLLPAEAPPVLQILDDAPSVTEPPQEQSPPAASGQGVPLPAEGERFHLEGLLGAGGMCEVHAAQDLRRVAWGDSEPRVAIKRLLPELRDNSQAQLALAQEFFMLRHLVHPGVVRAFDLHQQSWGLCYSMELLDGSSLHACEPAVLTKNAWSIAAQLFDVLGFLHAHGIVHNDIKPTNLFLAANGRLTLIDFNIAVAHSKHGAAASPVGKGIGAGLRLPGHSVLHASPACLRGDVPQQADDVFSACCTVYEVCAGAHPFGRRSALEAQEQNVRATKLDALSGKAWKLLAAGLAFDGADRPEAEDLRQVFAEKKSSALARLFSSSAS